MVADCGSCHKAKVWALLPGQNKTALTDEVGLNYGEKIK